MCDTPSAFHRSQISWGGAERLRSLPMVMRIRGNGRVLPPQNSQSPGKQVIKGQAGRRAVGSGLDLSQIRRLTEAENKCIN